MTAQPIAVIADQEVAEGPRWYPHLDYGIRAASECYLAELGVDIFDCALVASE